MPLVVVEKATTAAEGKISQAAVDAAAAEGKLIRISEIHLTAITKAGRAQGELPAADARAFDGDGEKEIGIVEIVVVKEVCGAREKVIGVKGPTAQGNGDAELMLFVALAVKRDEA